MHHIYGLWDLAANSEKKFKKRKKEDPLELTKRGVVFGFRLLAREVKMLDCFY